ncbi:diguanylate cyclase domain-containing protein [Actinoplanes sp. NPDC049265]|uniref:diguanylate cyclase domain-containing protein n=1 Tax=Actinoplanes sp. NPDC049265 TaxID=3363902 RepID=UPI0037189E74
MGSPLRGWDTAGLVVLVGLGGFALVAIQLSGSSESALFGLVAGGAQLAFAVLGLVFALRTVRRGRALPRHLKRAWRLMLPAFALWPLTIVLYAIFPGRPFPGPADVGRLLIQPATLIGILAFARLPGSAAERAKLRLDAALVGVGSAMVLWFYVVSPALVDDRTTTWREIVPSVVHPLFGAALLFGISVVLMRGPGAPAARRPLLVLVASVLLVLVGDTVRAYVINQGGPFIPSALQTSLWTGGMFLFMLAPYVQCWYCRRPDRLGWSGEGTASSRPPRWPYLTVIPGYALLMLTVGVRDPFPSGGLIVGAFIVSSLVFARQMVAARESRRLAVTDGLTGLANRFQLYEELPRALARASRNGTHVGVLVIDMNGFKQVNDTLGHRAGDQLLVGFGHLLRRCVLGSDLVARLGGDEFAIVLPDLTDEAQARAVVRRITAAMAEPIDVGETMVQPSASIGVALSDPGEFATDDVVARADVAMYESKKNRAAA